MLPPIKVGQIWRRADDKVVTVFFQDSSPVLPFRVGTTRRDVYWYGHNHKAAGASADKDLVELITDAPAPQPGPEPAPHPEKPQVGQVWKTRSGTYVTITGQDAAGVFTCTTNHFIQRADLLEPVTYPKVPRLFTAPLRRTLSKDGNTCIVDALADDGTCWNCQLGVDYSRNHFGETARTDWQQITPLPDREEPTNV